jgi:hypothetical protein
VILQGLNGLRWQKEAPFPTVYQGSPGIGRTLQLL